MSLSNDTVGEKQYSNEEILAVFIENEELKHENYKLSLRLDACLYSMVQMQAIIKAHEKKTPKNIQYRASFNDPGKVWLAE